MTDFTNKAVKYGGYGFTKDQETALDLMSDWCNNPNDILFTLSGRAGTGKTYITKYLIDKVIRQTLCVSAPTHKAVRQIERSTGRKGKTLQSLHGLRPNVNLEDFDLHNVKFDQLGNPTMNNYRFIIIDECSMINEGLHTLNVKRARDLRTKILYIGDPKQLPPVAKNDNDLVLSPTFNVKNHYELKEIIRQNIDNPLTKLLEIIVDDVDNNTANFIQYLKKYPIQINDIGEGYKVYNNSTDFVKEAINCFTSDTFSNDPDYARIAAWKNQTVLNYNIAIRNAVSSYFLGEPTKELIDINDLLIGYKTITDEFNDLVITNSEDYVIKRVVPRTSEDGFKSYAVRIEPRHGGKEVDINIVDYRDKSFMVYYEKIKQLYFRANYDKTTNRSNKWREYFQYKDAHMSLITFPIKQGDDIKTYVSKDIDYAFSLTVHKLQGSTIENTFVDLNDMLYYTTGRVVENSTFAPNATEIRNKLIYTAISRTSKICNIYLNI